MEETTGKQFGHVNNSGHARKAGIRGVVITYCICYNQFIFQFLVSEKLMSSDHKQIRKATSHISQSFTRSLGGNALDVIVLY